MNEGAAARKAQVATDKDQVQRRFDIEKVEAESRRERDILILTADLEAKSEQSKSKNGNMYHREEVII